MKQFKKIIALTVPAALIVGLGASTPAAAKVSAYDNNGDGVVDRTEFDQGVSAHGGFALYDRDRDGRWSGDEFRARFNNRENEFEEFDTNKDGYLSSSEFHTGVYGRFDANGDGRLDTKEGASFDASMGTYWNAPYDDANQHKSIIEDNTKLDIKAK